MKKTIFLGYRRAIGIMDVQGIVNYMKNNEPFEKVILVSGADLTEPVKKYIEKYLKPLVPVEVIVEKNYVKKAREMDHFGDNVWAVNLNEFGDRAMSEDAD